MLEIKHVLMTPQILRKNKFEKLMSLAPGVGIFWQVKDSLESR